MLRDPIPVTDVKPGDLIITDDKQRVRVSSILTNVRRAIVILYGRSPGRGEVGIPVEMTSEVVRLV